MKTDLFALIRHTLTFFGGLAVTNGYTAESEMTAGVGALMTLGGLAWSWAQKRGKAL